MTASGGGSGRHAVGHAGVQYSDQYGDQSDTQSGMQPVPSVAPAYDAQQTPQQPSQQPPRRKRRVLGSVVGIIGEIFLTLAVVCALYIVWQLWWTGVVSEQTQEKQSSEVSWTAPSQSDGSYQIAKAQKGDPPIIDKPSAGD
ncbi:MAG: hypothetical protein LKJ28_01620, partial [Bifidobacteriaceae bacterium]|nr:hypothetical protein [Bifidobacteriaceae bacterium]